jgi:hypothetical protein
MSRGQQLEKNLANIMRSFFTPSYWPNRSGLQNGYDAYANFKINGKEYFWKFECKDHNKRRHNDNFGDVSEIEFSNFSDKILELMSMGDSYYPDVFCLVIPHKRYKSNPVFAERLTSLNVINKFPFKIVLWDFDFLKDRIPFLNILDANDIYPNAPDKNKQKHEEIISSLQRELEKESVDGYLHRRSYIRERQAKHSLLVNDVLHIKIEEIINDPAIPPQYKFESNSQHSIFDNDDISSLSINTYPYTLASTKDKNTLKSTFTEAETLIKILLTEEKKFDTEQYSKMVDEKKLGLIRLFQNKDANGNCLFALIKNFCLSHTQGVVSFVCPSKHLLLASLPIRELTASDFESENGIHFYIEFKDI